MGSSKKPIWIAVPAGFEDLVPQYLAYAKEEARQMAVLLASHDFEEIIRRAHNLKGTGNTYGFDDVTEWGGMLEDSAGKHDEAAIHRVLSLLSEYLERAVPFAGAKR